MKPDKLEEDKFIKRLLPQLSKKNLLPGNDDAIAFKIPENEMSSPVVVVNTDSIAWSTDALPMSMSQFEFGRKLVSVTVSDVITKGAKPYFFLSSIMVPESFSTTEVELVKDGMLAGCKEYALEYMGGDLGSSKELVLTGIVIGFAKEKKVIKRSTACPHDYICSTGSFGYTGLGFLMYLEQKSFALPEKILETIHEKLLYPQARLDWLPYLTKYASATIDSSDGLFKSLQHLSSESNIQININKAPAFDGLENICFFNSLDYLKAVFFAGEEFEIIFTISKENYDLLIKELTLQGKNLPIVMGEAFGSEKKIYYNQKELVSQTSWDSFKGFSNNS